MTALGSIISALEDLVGDRSGPVVAFSAAWPFMRVIDADKRAVPAMIKDVVRDVVGPDRTLAMPTFTNGFSDGVCDLDNTPSGTGVISEAFRRDSDTRRTVSAFFSFAVTGPDADYLVTARPLNAWGDGSLYEWSEGCNATYLMLGTHVTHNSYLHRMEWLRRDVVNYRYEKWFKGTVIHEGRREPIAETLFVRSLDPIVETEFTFLESDLLDSGMRVSRPSGIPIAAIDALTMKRVFMERLEQDPYCCCVDRNRVAEHFGVKNHE